MSKFVQKTLHSINAVLNNSGMFYTEKDRILSTRNIELSAFVVKMKKVQTKHEEEDLVSNYFSRIERRLSEPDVSNSEVDEMVRICMVCEVMGYTAHFIYVHSLKLAQKGNFQQKYMGYLSAAFFLHPHHELVILLINTLQRDLNSSNHLEVILALTAVCHLISNETVQNVFHLVEDKLQHPVSSVRKLAVLTLSHCLQLCGSPNAYQIAFPKLERSLSDPELEVVSVVVPTINRVIKELSGDFSYLIDSLLQLLEQILMRRIPHSLNYSDIPAPWLQIEILKLLKCLCNTPESSRKLCPVLKKILVQTGVFHTLAQAIIYQVIETVGNIEADAELLEASMGSVSLLLKSRDVNIKLNGLEGLVLLMKKMDPNITSTQQDVIMDCLRMPDETLQLKTLELMYHLANPSNVQAICKKMIEFLDQIKEMQRKKDLSLKILQLAEKHLIRHNWYISVVSAVLLKTDTLITSSDICNTIYIITKDDDLRRTAKEEFVRLLKEAESIPSSLIKVYSSVLTEPSEFLPIIPLMLFLEEDALTWLLTSLMESILKFRTIPPDAVTALVELEKKFEDTCSHIFLRQLLQIIQNIIDVKEYDVNAKVDPSLTCLDNFVLQSLQESSECYEPPSFRMVSLPLDRTTCDLASSNFCIIGAGETETCESSFTLKSPTYSIFSSPSISFQSLSSDVESISPFIRNKVVWTQEGRSRPDEETVSSKGKTERETDELLELFAGMSGK